ncbi:E3 ubiquitin-protein ligase TRIM45-like [Mytilus galloprovincialis]|uniref:E3 ubiquitin-protein ligase TRIM45-like n=1 Tax=Mytilus galloprovincialis TaxID=29158 RepID=UPI003F7BBDCC
MAQGNYSDIESKCGICLSPYTEPRLLECFHTFCTPCLEKLDVNENNVTCPLCRTQIALPDNGVSGLKTYPFYVEPSHRDNELMDICELCSEENYVVAKCLDCKIDLCVNCRDYHKKLKASQNHSLQNLKLDESKQHHENPINECNEHRKEITLFCVPCNTFLCSECSEKAHRLHKVQNLSQLVQTRKKMLLARTASLKSRISVIGNTAERVKQEENYYYKNCSIVKKDILAHATSIKDVFCNAVDILTNKHLATIDNTKKIDIKVIDTYSNEIETEQLSLAGLIKTTEDFIASSTDKELMVDAFIIGGRLDKVLNKTLNPLSLHVQKYECKEFTEATVANLLGKINTSKVNVITPLYTQLPIPELFPKVEKVHSFQLPDCIIKDIVAANNDNVWIFNGNLASLVSRDGILRSAYAPPKGSRRMLRKSADEIWFWTGQSAVKKVNSQFQEGYKVSFDNGSVGCFNQNGNLLVYNKEENAFCEVSEKEGVQNKIKITDPKNKLQNTNFFPSSDILMAETKNSNYVISTQNDTVIIITNKQGRILETSKRSNTQFKCIAVDNYGNIIVSDCINGSIDILSENGVFQRNLLNTRAHFISIVIDECGFLWACEKGYQTVKTDVYSYQ